jgi:hypothetical protein
MRKIFLPLITIGFILVSCENHNLSDSYWIAVKSYPIPPEKGNGGYDGMTIHFSNNKLIFGYVLDERNRAYDLRINDKKIFLNDTLWALTFAEYQDSLILDIRQNARVKFIKLDKEHSLVEKPKLWEHKNWILSFNDYQRELFLTHSPFLNEPSSKLCIQKDLQVNQFIRAIGMWKTVNINGNQLFVKTFNQVGIELYRIKRYVGDSIIKLEPLRFPDVKSDLRKKYYISESKKQNILNQIQNFKWKTDKIIDLDTISEGSRNWDSTYVKMKSLKDKRLSFKFSDDLTYNIYESESSVSNGNWKVSETGDEIILNSGIYPSDYIDLINVDKDSLVIGNLHKFEPITDNYGLIVELYYKITLKK